MKKNEQDDPTFLLIFFSREIYPMGHSVYRENSSAAFLCVVKIFQKRELFLLNLTELSETNASLTTYIDKIDIFEK